MAKHRIYTMSFASVYPHYVAKAEKKGRTKAEVDEIIAWLTGYEPDRAAGFWTTGRTSKPSSPRPSSEPRTASSRA